MQESVSVVVADGDLVVLNDRSREDTSGFALARRSGPAGGLWLQPLLRHQEDRWGLLGPVARWTAADLGALLRWWQEVADGADGPGARPLWVGAPALGLRRISRSDGVVSIDLCRVHRFDSAWPQLSGREAVPQDGEEFDYVTVDVLPQDWRAALSPLSRWFAEIEANVEV